MQVRAQPAEATPKAEDGGLLLKEGRALGAKPRTGARISVGQYRLQSLRRLLTATLEGAIINPKWGVGSGGTCL